MRFAVQTPAERHLVRRLASFLASRGEDPGSTRILNAGAGQSLSIERQLDAAGVGYICDRTDVDDCRVAHSSVGECWQCSIDAMTPVPSGRYTAVFANYVLEHVEDIKGAARELFRVLAPGGLFITTVPNSSSPEFLLARHTPLWFHRAVRGGHGWETRYAYRNISELKAIFVDAGFRVQEERYWSFVEGYLSRYGLLRPLARLYDRTVTSSRLRPLMGNVCLVLAKP